MFRKSSYSDHQGDCVEVGRAEDGVLVRDSKNLGVAPLRHVRVSDNGWKAFLSLVKAGRYDS